MKQILSYRSTRSTDHLAHHLRFIVVVVAVAWNFCNEKENNMLTVRCKSDCKNLGTYFSVTKRRVGYSYFLWKSEVWTGMCGVSVNTEILTVMSTIQSPLEHWLHWHRCHWQEKVPKCVPLGFQLKLYWFATSSALMSSMKQLATEAASIKSCSQNISSLLDIYIELHTFSKAPCLFLEMVFAGRT